MNLNKKLIACVAILSVLTTQTVIVKAETSIVSTTVIKTANEIIGGKNRVETALQIADKVYKNFGESTTAIIANGDDAHVVDALAVAPLAYQKKAAILLTTGNSINIEVMNKLKSAAIKNVYIIGFMATDKNKDELEKAGYTVTEISGKDRFNTAININKVLGKTSKVAVVNGYAEIDALSIGSIAAKSGMQIILSNSNELPENTPNIEAETKIYVVGGQAAISNNLMTKLNAIRLGGDTRYETNASVIAEFKNEYSTDKIYVSNGETKGVDALSGAVLAAQSSSPIVISGNKYDAKNSMMFSGVKEAIRLGRNVNEGVFNRLIGKPVVKVPVSNVLPLVYTWSTVRSTILNANIGPNLRELTNTYEDGTTFTRLDYDYLPNSGVTSSFSNVFNVFSMKGKEVPNMDFGMGVYGNNSGDPKITSNCNYAGTIIYEAIFPKHGEDFLALLEKVKLRHVTKDNLQVHLPTVIFFQGRRVIVSPYTMGFYRMYFSAVNDKSDIWKQIYYDDDIKHVMPNKADVKKYMPELKNY